jgi:hypothetical protein
MTIKEIEDQDPDQNQNPLKTYGDLKKIITKVKSTKNFDKAKKIGGKGLSKAVSFIPGIGPLGATAIEYITNAADIADLAKTMFNSPDTKKTDTWLDKLNIDDQVSAIVDDTVENGYLQALIKNLKSKNDNEELPDDFSTTKDLQLYLQDKYRGRSVTNQNNESVSILRELLLMEEEKPQTFEENPMEFILNKYASLNEVMTELMTESYREYLDAVFIVSPKPTSFKVVLHNGQYFYLTYMGPAYEASVAGKNYYLSGVGEKERCMLAISKLLRGGNPLKTKGPEGAEQEAAAEEGGESGGGGLSAVGGGEAEAEAGGEESLTESKNIIKALLAEQIKEAKNSKLIDTLISTIGGKKNSKKGLHVRGDFGSEEEVNRLISSSMKNLKLKNSDYEVTTIYPGDFDNGAKSSSFNTYKVTIKNQTPAFDKGEEVFIVSREKQTSSESYSLKPQELGIPDSLMSKDELINIAKKGVNSNANISNTEKKYLIQLLTNSVKLNTKEQQEILNNRNFINQIEKNYGEILGAIHMLESNTKYKVEFPSIGNFPLVDFFLKKGNSVISVSSKAASASGNTIKIKNILDRATQNKVGIDPKLKSILDKMATSSIIEMPKEVASIITDSDEITSLKNRYIKSKSGKDLYNLESAIIKYVNQKYAGDIQDIVSASIGDIIYVKTKIEKDLKPQFIVKKPEALRFKLRSKNAQTRFKDRVGFDVK